MDIAELLARPHDMNLGDAARYVEGFAADMACVGYSPLTIGGYLDSVIHFGGWLQAQGLSLAAIDESWPPTPATRNAIWTLLTFLRAPMT